MRTPQFTRWAVSVVLTAGLVVFAMSCQTQPGDDTGAVSEDSLQRAERLTSGHQAYLAHCAMCHGTWGAGDGPLSSQLADQGITKPAILNNRARFDELGRDQIVVY